ncbi:hypothetical protein BCR37DRAFT_394162 [Protomyces lactucae-debilis]|uniref:Trm112p-domain-containing protein n=1 Tax=Protomyces lactucae-debilis TaxID=2754530 RepID=A0A1Y2F6C4_PROLT|nr:uncharacterized protein BCR37DRAFT_394162 [Protomyces lactucae-debilis]ORY79431.1 hypothetical protein BCR37DRAFT_394162 [Protomyces lactucae-debilis]
MKLLTTNFLTCAVKQCRGTAEAYPLNLSDCQLEISELDFNPAFLTNILPRIEWPALVKTCAQLGSTALPSEKPESLSIEKEDDLAVLKSLHNLLLETSIKEGKMTCGRCDHIYLVKEGIANMLLHEHEVA